MSNKWPPQYLFALALLLCAAIIGLFSTLYIKPKQEAITTMRSDLESKQSMATTYREAAAKLPQLKTDVAKLQADRAEFVRALPTTTQFGQVVAQIRTNVAAANADLKSLNFVGSTVTNLPAGVRATDISLDLSGRFSQLFQVLRSLETQSRFTTINSINLTSNTATSLDPALSGKYTMTVYTFDPALAADPAQANASAPAAPSPANTTPPASTTSDSAGMAPGGVR